MPLHPAATVRRVHTGGVELEIAEAGQGGRPLLLVHGFAGAKEDFGDWWDELAERGWHVVALDLRGHGASDHPPRHDDYSLEIFEADVVALVDELGWDHFVILGHSMGGMIAQDLALHRRDRLEAIVLMDTVPGPPTVSGGRVLTSFMKLMTRPAGRTLMARLVRKPPPRSPASVRRLYAHRPGYADWLQAKALATSPVMARAMLSQLGDRPDRLSALGALDLPVLLIAGEHDLPGFADATRAMASAIPGAELAILDGAAHSPQLETPDLWWSAVSGFLDALPTARTRRPDLEGSP